MNREAIDYACPIQQTRRTPWQNAVDLARAIVLVAACVVIAYALSQAVPV